MVSLQTLITSIGSASRSVVNQTTAAKREEFAFDQKVLRATYRLRGRGFSVVGLPYRFVYAGGYVRAKI